MFCIARTKIDEGYSSPRDNETECKTTIENKENRNVQVIKVQLLREYHNKCKNATMGKRHLEEVDDSFKRVTSSGRA